MNICWKSFLVMFISFIIMLFMLATIATQSLTIKQLNKELKQAVIDVQICESYKSLDGYLFFEEICKNMCQNNNTDQ